MKLEEAIKKEIELASKPRKFKRKTKKDLIIQELKEDWENIKQALLEGKIKAKSIYRYLVEEKGLQISDVYFYRILNELLENDEEILRAKREPQLQKEINPVKQISKSKAKEESTRTKNQLSAELEAERKKRMQGKVDLDELDRELGLI